MESFEFGFFLLNIAFVGFIHNMGGCRPVSSNEYATMYLSILLQLAFGVVSSLGLL